MRGLLLPVLVLAALSGCRARIMRVIVPDTTESKSCQLACYLDNTACRHGMDYRVCDEEQMRCLLKCPGAVLDDERD